MVLVKRWLSGRGDCGLPERSLEGLGKLLASRPRPHPHLRREEAREKVGGPTRVVEFQPPEWIRQQAPIGSPPVTTSPNTATFSKASKPLAKTETFIYNTVTPFARSYEQEPPRRLRQAL